MCNYIKTETMSLELFSTNKSFTQYICKNCIHRERWECGSKVIQYCGTRKSNRTDNGLLKIKANDMACELFEQENK